MDFSERRRVISGPDVRAQAQQQHTTQRRMSQAARKTRGAALLATVHRLDGQLDQAATDEVLRWIRNEYANEMGDIPLGLVAACHLGPPYVDHRLDLFQSILQHFAPADVMPEPFAQARMLARVSAYEYIEVYASGAIVPVRADGSPVV